MRETNQTRATILNARDFVCQALDASGLQMAWYLSKAIATMVHTETDTDTAVKIKDDISMEAKFDDDISRKLFFWGIYISNSFNAEISIAAILLI